MFSFGPETWGHGPRGATRRVKRFGIHLQCAWRILDHGLVLLGADDLYVQRSDLDPGTEIDVNNLGASRREELLAAFFEARAAEPRVVAAVTTPRLGNLRICLDDGSVLEVLPDEVPRGDQEYWRFVDVEGPHLVVGNGTFEKVG